MRISIGWQAFCQSASLSIRLFEQALRKSTWRVVFCLAAAISLAGSACAGDAQLKALGTIYGRAQTVAWMDRDLFAVGRWDGTLSLFRVPTIGTTATPILAQVLQLPSDRAPEMIARVSDSLFVSSNDDHSLALWHKHASFFGPPEVIGYDPAYGTANSSALTSIGQTVWLVTGHSEGYVLIWSVTAGGIRFISSVNVRSSNPIPSQYRLWNVRGVVPWKDYVVTGSEDGDICLINIPNGTIRSRMRYNSSAQRGINWPAPQFPANHK